MQVKSVNQNIGSVKPGKQKTENIQAPRVSTPQQSSVSFTGGSPNIIVGLMDFIAAGGFAASFCIQDGLGFIAPRVYKGLKRGGKKKHDENGNEILNKNGEPKRELNWAYARKEGIREIITGPSAFIIPYFLLKGINKKFGRSNSVKLDYIDGFKNIFTDYAKNNKDAIINKTADKKDFYKSVFKEVIETTINDNPKAVKVDNVEELAETWAKKQAAINDVIEKYDKKKWLCWLSPKNKKARNEELAQIGSVTDDFIELKKKHVGGISDHAGISIKASNYTAENMDVKHGNIGKLTEAMANYFDDAVKSTHNALKDAKDTKIEDIVKKFTGKKLGSRILTNLGLFAAVALFYTQIPKLYNMGTGGKNPALMNDDEAPSKVSKGIVKRENQLPQDNGRNVSFGSGASALEKFGNKVFNTNGYKKISDIFELNGPIIQGQAMSVLLYGACIPPRLVHAQDKYDFGEILVRDMTAFSALLFGAKALSRLFSDGFTKVTGLALNSKNLEGRNIFQKTWDYLNPANTRHTVLSSKELESKYTNIRDYKDGVDGFVEFIEGSSGNIKKTLSHDKNIKNATEDILKKHYGEDMTFAKATKEQIKTALHEAKEAAPELLNKFYDGFHGKNKLLTYAKTCNSAFDFLSTLVLVPLLIYNLTNICQRMTEKRKAEENSIKNQMQALQAPLVPSSKPTMQGFLDKNAA